MGRMRLTILAPVPLLAGCGAYSTLIGTGGGQASRLAGLGWGLIVLMSIVTLAMVVLVVWGALRRRGTFDGHLPIDVDGGKRWILLGGIALPVTVLTILFGVTLATLQAAPLPEDSAVPKLALRVTAHQWWWEVEYLYDDLTRRFTTANELHIPVAVPVEVELQSTDVIHSFWVPRLHGKLDAIPGHTNRLVLEADAPGTYRGLCAELCGVQHAGMRFRIVAEPEGRFRAWAERQRQPAPAPATDLLAKGREAFETFACAMCHTIRGTRARGSVAPDLTHFGSRDTIAGVLPNTRARLQAWIVNAQSFKPGTKMPSLDQFDGETLNALASYLESLE